MPATNLEPIFLGIDVGGTNIKIGMVSDSGRLIGSTSFSTCVEKGPGYAVDQTLIMVQRLLSETDFNLDEVRAAGLGTPGPMDIPNGLILSPTNLPTWRNFPIRDRLSDALDLPVTFTNDANAAAFGEFWLGSASRYNSLVMFTLGTGVGGGIIINDFCIEGEHSLGAELGHVRVDWSPTARRCSCGQRGHIEAYSSATAVVARTAERLAGSKSTLKNVVELTAKNIAEAAEKGDSLANEIIDETADYLARGIDIIANTIDPEAILLGGAMTFGGSQTQTGRRFLQTIMDQVKKSVFPEISEALKIDYASLGSDAGFIGAAGLARLNYHRHPDG